MADALPEGARTFPYRKSTASTYCVEDVRSPHYNEVIEARRPTVFATRFGNAILRGTNRTTFEPEGRGTRLRQEFVTQGVIPAIAGWIFSLGSYRGSFRGEVEHFALIASAQAVVGSFRASPLPAASAAMSATDCSTRVLPRT